EDAPMQAAARARAQTAPSAELPEPDDTDIAAVLTREHDRVTALFKQLGAVPGVSQGGSAAEQSRRAAIGEAITTAVARAEAAEEKQFGPWVRWVLDDGDKLAAAGREQEQQGQDIITALGQTPAGEDKYDDLAGELEKAARQHVAFEDRVLLALQQATSDK